MKLVKYLSIGLAATLAASLISCKEESADSSKRRQLLLALLTRKSKQLSLR